MCVFSWSFVLAVSLWIVITQHKHAGKDVHRRTTESPVYRSCRPKQQQAIIFVCFLKIIHPCQEVQCSFAFKQWWLVCFLKIIHPCQEVQCSFAFKQWWLVCFLKIIHPCQEVQCSFAFKQWWLVCFLKIIHPSLLI